MVTDLLTAPAGYHADLAEVRRQLGEQGAGGGPAAADEVLALRHREVTLAGGRPDELLALGRDVDVAVARFPTRPRLRLLRASIALAVHRPDVALAALRAPGLTAQPPGRVLAADIALFTGDYPAARNGYSDAAQQDPGWETTARLAALALATGSWDDAEELYAAAEDELPAGQLRACAWLRVQRAELAQAAGDPDLAGRLLTEAERVYPGWWYVRAHRAALDVALERWDRAIDGYRTVLADVDRAEFREALGTAFAGAGRSECAAECHAIAVSAYLASVARGERHHLHHLAAFHADVRPHPTAALAWARQDADLRRTGPTLGLLAWCLCLAGRRTEALTVLDEAFALGAGDPVLCARARRIRQGDRA